MEERKRYRDVDLILKNIFKDSETSYYYTLEELFEQKLIFLNITKNQALKILDIDHKTLNAFLSGKSRKIDFVTILKLSDFLKIPHDELVNKYFELIDDTYKDHISQSKRRNFIVHNFNLQSLKTIGLIDSIIDFDHIEERINSFLGYESIFEHEKYQVNAAVFSSGKRATNKENLSLWYATAIQSLDKTPNPNEFDRKGLIEYFPQIRWHSMNINTGFLIVCQYLFKLGVTVICVPKLTSDLHVRGATLSHRGKPCIVLTNYTRFYATLWFSLIHELFHVLYDWDEIVKEKYHISNETSSLNIDESEADNFARQYLFSDEKMEEVKPKINQHSFVEYFAGRNHVHPSIIYSFYSWDYGGESYKKFDKFNPFKEYQQLLSNFRFDDFKNFVPVNKISKTRNSVIYNSI